MTTRRFLRILRLRWRTLTRPSGLDRELDREFDFHYAQLVRELADTGLPAAEAQRVARRAMGNAAAARDYARDHRRLSWVHDLGRDLAYAGRGLWQRPAFAATAVVALTVGLATPAAVLTLIDVNVVRPLSIPRADRLVVLRTQSQVDGREHDQSSLTEFLAWKSQAACFESVESSVGGDRDVSADADGHPAVRVSGRNVTPGWFELLGVRPSVGRVLRAADYASPRGTEVVMISHDLWQRRYGGDPQVLNRVIQVNRADARIVGVMPAAFPYQAGQVQLWLPLRLDPDQTDGATRWFNVVALRRPGVSIAEAQTEAERVSATLVGRLPPNLDWRPRVVSLRTAEYGWVPESLRAETIVAVLILLVAVANVSGLIIARNATRGHEFAIRVAVGATLSRLVRQVVAEGLLLASFAVVPSMGVAAVALRAFAVVVTPPIGAPPLQTDGAMPILAGVVVALAMAVGLVIGAASAVSCLGRAVVMAPRVPARTRYMRAGVVGPGVLGALQIAASVVLLVSASLLVETYLSIAHRDLHFDQRRLLLFQVRAPGPAPQGILRAIADSVKGLDQAEAVGGVSDWWFTTLILPRTAVYVKDPKAPIPVKPVSLVVTPGLFSVLRLPLLSGREFTDADTAVTPWAIVVNRAAGNLLWPHEDPLGRMLGMAEDPTGRLRQVIGVVADTPLHRADVEFTPMIFTSYLQQPPYHPPAIGVGPAGRMAVVARYRGDRDAVVRDVLSRAASVAPSVPLVYGGPIQTAGLRVTGSLGRGLGLAALGLVGLALAAISVYGLTATVAAERTRELAIRAALGAGFWHVLVRGGLVSVVVAVGGLASGVLGALTLSRAIAPELWGVRSDDPWNIAGVLILVAGGAAAVMWVPLRQTLARNPAEVLRSE